MRGTRCARTGLPTLRCSLANRHRVARAMQSQKFVGRIGGDEFVVAGRVDPNNVENQVRRLEDATSRASLILTQQFRLSFSFGNVISDASQPASLEELIRLADELMYESKRNKKKPRSEPAAAPV